MTAKQKMSKVRVAVGLLLLLPSPLLAQAQKAGAASQSVHSALCPLVEAAARANALPVNFFARLIWAESRFRPDTVGPLTSRGERAEGIAQFMPYTALEQHVDEPFDAGRALQASGKFLASLRQEFGNLGLAAAAYNAGPQRVRDFVTGVRGLPKETRNYVQTITGRSVEDWKGVRSDDATVASPATQAPITCDDIVAALERDSEESASTAAEQRRVPSWCGGLRHPDIKICGPVHLGKSGKLPNSRVNPNGHLPKLKASLR
ncbi:MAG TPA: lytic transglycosylase domain-containing protein [Pirellulales bacterium]|jgi:hypothetical protein